MSVQVRYRREAAAFLASFVGAQGELLIDTTNNRVQVHDGATPGGFPAAKLSEVVTNTRTQVADASYTALANDRNIAITSLTAPRTITLPAASVYPTGTQLVVFDESGACSAGSTITVARSGSDTVNGAASATIATAYGYLAFESNGAGKWTITDQTAATTGSSGTPRTVVADASYTALPTDRLVAFTSLTAARTVTLPAASAFSTGTQLFVIDETGSCSSTSTITIARTGSDTVNGAASATIATAYGYLAFESNGAGRWTIVDQAVTASSGPKNNFAATADPSATSDTTLGYSAGSFWLRTDTGDMWRCRSAVTGAAVWARLAASKFFGYRAGNWYRAASLQTAAGTTYGASRPVFFPLVIEERCTIAALDAFISNPYAGGNLQIALYASDPATKYPTGAPLTTTASMSTGSYYNVSGAVSVQLDPGLYWFAVMVDNTSAQLLSYSFTHGYFDTVIGNSYEPNTNTSSTSIALIWTAVTFGSWPSVTPSGFPSPIDGNSYYTPAIAFKVGSVP